MKIESLITTKKRLLDEDEMNLFLMAIRLEAKEQEIPPEAVDMFLYKILSKRLAFFHIPVSEPLIMFLSCIIDSPGKAVMWAYALNEIYKKTNSKIMFSDFVSNEFGMGIPTEEEYKRIWDAQKVKREFPLSDNALDNPENWK